MLPVGVDLLQYFGTENRSVLLKLGGDTKLGGILNGVED